MLLVQSLPLTVIHDQVDPCDQGQQQKDQPKGADQEPVRQQTVPASSQGQKGAFTPDVEGQAFEGSNSDKYPEIDDIDPQFELIFPKSKQLLNATNLIAYFRAPLEVISEPHGLKNNQIVVPHQHKTH